MPEVGILILDDDPASQLALTQVLDSEGWRVKVLAGPDQVMPELASGNWTLVIANVAMTGLEGPLFQMLRELGEAVTDAAGHAQVRVLFTIPEHSNPAVQRALEAAHLPFALKPLHLHDFLERVADLLFETQSITGSLRKVKSEVAPRERRAGVFAGARRAPLGRRDSKMFASRDDYQMTEEEILEFERKEKEEEERKKRKKQQERDTPL